MAMKGGFCMTSRERMLRALRGEATDRVPITTYDLPGYNPFAYCNQEPSYRGLMDMIRERADCLCMWSAKQNAKAPLSAADVGILSETARASDGLITTDTLRIEQRTLSRKHMVRDGVHTVWRREYWCKDMDDVDAILSLPYEPLSYDFSEYQPMRDALADHGIVMQSFGDSNYATMTLMNFSDSLEWVMCEPDHYEQALNIMHERNMRNLDVMLSGPIADIYRITGPEYLTPPYLPPHLFERFALPTLRDIVQRIHKAGARVDIHSHGCVGKTAAFIAQSGADAMDPCEPPPDGDITLSDLKRLVGDKICLIGNLEARILEQGTAKEVREATRTAMLEGKQNGRFIMGTSGGPIESQLSDGVEDRYRAYLETALEYADY